MNIHNLAFYDKPPQPKWLFRGDFNGLIKNWQSGKERKQKFVETLNSALVSWSLPPKTISVVQTYAMGLVFNHQGRYTNNGEVTLTFNENCDLEVTRAIEEIFHNASFCDNFLDAEDYPYSEEPDNSKGRTFKIYLISPKAMEVGEDEFSFDSSSTKASVCIMFHNCFISELSGEDFSYNNPEEVLTRTIKISYDLMTITSIAEQEYSGNVNTGCIYDQYQGI